MNLVKFTAKVAHASKEDDFYMVGFADDKYEYHNYLILQKAFEIDSDANEINGVEIILTEVKIGKKLIRYLKKFLGDKLEIVEE